MNRQKNSTNSQLIAPRPCRVAIVLPPRFWAGSVMLVRELLQVAGTLAARSVNVQSSGLFQIVLVGPTREPVPSFGGVAVVPEATFLTRLPFDAVVIPAQFAPDGEASAEERLLGEWLARQRAGGALLICIGSAALLAKAGLLQGREVTGLVSDRALFRRKFPDVRFNPSRSIIASADLITVSGIGPTVDACAHLVDRFFGANLARRFLRHTSTDKRSHDEKLSLWGAQFKRHTDAQVLRVQEQLETDLEELPSLAELAAQCSMSERTLSRRFVAATGHNLRSYVAQLRLVLAEHLLTTSAMPLVHVAHTCGFASVSAFSRAVQLQLGVSPMRYRVASAAAVG